MNDKSDLGTIPLCIQDWLYSSEPRFVEMRRSKNAKRWQYREVRFHLECDYILFPENGFPMNPVAFSCKKSLLDFLSNSYEDFSALLDLTGEKPEVFSCVDGVWFTVLSP